MALKTVISFPIFSPIPTTSTTPTSTTVIRFSRWNNANADKFNHRPQQSIEDDLRRFHRFQSALNIATNYQITPLSSPPPYKSSGTPSSPSRPSIPGRKSKYSKQNYRNTPDHTHPAFRKGSKRPKFPSREKAEDSSEYDGETEVKVGDVGGLRYVVPGAPFEFMYSYTEGPKGVRPVGLREEAVAPFGPRTMPRPWTGRKPLSKKQLPEFDSFKPPPAGKKGVKPVQKPGPYLPGTGPRYVMSREEVLGEELTAEEVKELVEGCRKSKRQLNIGRDGLTHNMLDNIHAHWKRRRVCKIKCKGVCTVDMNNVCEQLEERTGGKIINRRGGSLYLFRGRNYNYKTRPRFPLMLWKPVSPVYPRLVKRVPEGLTLEEASDMRKRGRDLIPICKLGKNGVYVNLVKTVKEAFEVCDLVRINCQGLNPSDYRKIGAKLKDLVPCVLISFECEHILMWRGKDWSSTLMLPETDSKGYQISETDRDAFLGPDSSDPSFSDEEQDSESCSSNVPYSKTCDEMPSSSVIRQNDSDVSIMRHEDTLFVEDDVPSAVKGVIPEQTNDTGSEDLQSETTPSSANLSDIDIKAGTCSSERESTPAVGFYDVDPISASWLSDLKPDALSISDLGRVEGSTSRNMVSKGELEDMVENTPDSSPSVAASPCTNGVLFLLRQALDSGSAVVLDDSSLDADVIFQKSVAFAQVAPPGPAFKHRPPKTTVQKSENKESVVLEGGNAVQERGPENKPSGKTLKDRKNPRTKKPKDWKEEFLDVVPQGSLKIDELAKLLA